MPVRHRPVIEGDGLIDPLRAPVSGKRGLDGNDILTLDKAAGVLPRRDVPEPDVAL
jgi:hypothetical protein